MKIEKCVIFGAGNIGTQLYKKLSRACEVIAYSDNDSSLWGTERNQTRIIPPEELPGLVEATGATIVIANKEHYLDIAKQLDSLGLAYYICRNFEYMTYILEDGILHPAPLIRPEPYRKPANGPYSVLFVQVKPCARTNKIAEALKNKGIFTYSAYTTMPSDEESRAFSQASPFWTFSDLLNFVNESEFDVIHCSNTPDVLVNLLICSNKKVIHDCHDVTTIHKILFTGAEEVLELIANTQTDGMIYPAEPMRELIIKRHGTKKDRTMVLENYPLSMFEKVERLPKLSAADGQIHCVYEGGIVNSRSAKTMPQRFLEPIFVQLANAGAHVHIYSHRLPEYLTQLAQDHVNIHYEGNYSGIELIRRMTQYDLGLAYFPLAGMFYPEITSAHKVYEYLSAGLPVVTNVRPWAEMIEANHCGGSLDLEHDDILEKLRSYQQIPISMDFCDSHGFTMDANVDRILEFYKKISMN